MSIKVICVGKIKKDYLKEGITDYLKMLQPYMKTEIIEVLDSSVSINPSQSEIEKVKKQEGMRVLKFIKDNDFVINLDLNKKELDSIEFANFIDKKLTSGNSNLTFIIGGSYGLSDELKNRANDSISLSKMTFLHQMTRLILLEQIYRAFKILNNETYHK